MHQNREQPYVKWLDADGVCRYRFGRAKSKDDAIPQDVHLQQEASELHEFFLANHHAPADAADDGAHAAEDEGDLSPREGWRPSAQRPRWRHRSWMRIENSEGVDVR